MLPVLDASGRRTGGRAPARAAVRALRHETDAAAACPAGGVMLRNCLYLLPLGPAAYLTGLTGAAFACGASVATGAFAMTAAVFFKVRARVAAAARPRR